MLALYRSPPRGHAVPPCREHRAAAPRPARCVSSLRCTAALGKGAGRVRQSSSGAGPLHAVFPFERSLTEGPQASAGDGSPSRATAGAVTTSFSSWLKDLQARIFYPWDPRLHVWTGMATVAAALSGFLIPWEVAFEPVTNIYNVGNPVTGLEGFFLMVFGVDMLLSFRTAYYEGEAVVEDPVKITREYVRGEFLLDLLGLLPLDLLAMLLVAPAAFTDPQALAAMPAWIPLLKLLHMVRLYRVQALFQFLEYNLSFSLLNVTIVRNLAIVLYILHGTACGFYWEALQSGFDPDILSGADAAFFASLSMGDQYIYSLYWAVTTLSTVDLGGNVPSTMPQTISAATRALLFLLFNIALGSYILGTITLLVVKNDERTGKFRDRSASLRHYTQINSIPKELKDSMQGHLLLHFQSEEASDEQVLSIFPTPIRRRIMRYLYIKHLRGSYLFQSCPSRFLDALLASARVEVFMPGVDILSSGDQVNELLLVLNGAVEFLVPNPASHLADGMKSSAGAASGHGLAGSHDVMSSRDSSGSSGGSSSFEGDWHDVAAVLEGGRGSHPISATLDGFVSRREAGEGSLLGEAAFFTEVPQLEAVRSVSVCRVLIVNRAAYGSLERSFPAASRQVLQNLVEKADLAVAGEFQGTLHPSQLDAMSLNFEQWHYAWGSAELIDTLTNADKPMPPISEEAFPDVTSWTARQQQAVANLLRIRSLVKQYIARQDIEATTEFLYAASQGNVAKIHQMIQHGCEADKADYDGRTALELACVKGHVEVASLLLRAGANPNARDNLGSSALLEACRYGHDRLVTMLKTHGGRLGDQQSGVEWSSELCTCVYEGNLPLLRRLISAGVPVDSADYDKRTALHISAAEGNLQAVKLLVQEGGADVFVRDRWGFTPLDEACRVGDTPVVRYLESCMAQHSPEDLTGLDGWGI